MSLTDLTKRIIKALFMGGPPRTYRGRPCQGSRWRREFSDAEKRDVRTFLAMVAEAFSYPESEKLKFRPDDAVYRVYRERYRLSGWADAGELERFSQLMQKRYHIALRDLWTETLTLGELFEATRTKADGGRK